MSRYSSFQVVWRLWKQRFVRTCKALMALGAAGVAWTAYRVIHNGGDQLMHTAATTPAPHSTAPATSTSGPGVPSPFSQLHIGHLPIAEIATIGIASIVVLASAAMVGAAMLTVPEGFASILTIRRDMSRRSAKKSARQTRRSIDPRRAHWTEYGLGMGRAVRPWLRRIVSTFEDTILLVGPSRAYKSVWLANIILDAPGPVITTTTKANDVEATLPLRSQVGNALVWNPYGMGKDLPSTLRWSPVIGCENPKVALRRAALLLYGARKDSTSLESFFQSTAAEVLRSYLLAAALADLDMRSVMSWTTNADDDTAVQILTHYKVDSLWIEVLQQRQATTDRTRDSIYTTLSTTLSWMADPAVAWTACPTVKENFDLAEFLGGRNTLYLLAENRISGSVAALFTAFMGDLVEETKTIASAMPGGRLDPPLLMPIDEAANICPVPLPTWFSELPGQGMLPVAAIQSQSQMIEMWGQTGSKTIWNNAAWSLFLAGIKDPDDLKAIAVMLGTRPQRKTSTHHGAQGASQSVTTEQVDVMTPAAIRQLRRRRILGVYRGDPAVMFKVQKSWQRRDVRQAGREVKIANRDLRKEER